MNLKKINKELQKEFGNKVTAELRDDCIFVEGHLSTWDEVIKACQTAATKYSKIHVVNNIKCDEAKEQKMRVPMIEDKSLDGKHVDVLIIGGGISGASIARELSKWDIDILLVDKEADLALQASGRNDGEVHPGVDLSKGSLKHHYIRQANRMYGDVCKELDVPFKRVGQYVCFEQAWLKPFIKLYAMIKRKVDGIEDTIVVSKEELKAKEPQLIRYICFCIG